MPEMKDTATREMPVEEIELSPEDKALADALVEFIEKHAEWEEVQTDLADSFTEENLTKFLLGEKTLAQVLGLSMEEAYSIAELAYSLMEQGNLEDALALAEGLVVCNPQDGYMHSLLGSIYLKKGMTDEALYQFSLAVELDPSDIASWVNRGEILLNKGEFELALDDFKKAIELDPDGENPAGNRARALVTMTAALIRKVMESKGENLTNE